MEIVKDEHSRQVCYSTASIAKYGKEEYSFPKNRFLKRRLAKDIAKRVVSNYKWPHWDISVECSFLPYVNFVADDDSMMLIDVMDKQLFPLEPSHTVQCYLRKITHDPRNGKTILGLRAVLSY